MELKRPQGTYLTPSRTPSPEPLTIWAEMTPKCIFLGLLPFSRWASILVLTLLIGCTDTPSPSLKASDFADALRENGFESQIEKLKLFDQNKFIEK